MYFYEKTKISRTTNNYVYTMQIEHFTRSTIWRIKIDKMYNYSY